MPARVIPFPSTPLPERARVDFDLPLRTDEKLTRDQRRSRRFHQVRALTENMERTSKRRLELLGAEVADVDVSTFERPRTRGDCVDGPRPCPWASCRYHLYVDVARDGRSLKLNFPDLDVDEIPTTCALDVADAGPHQLEVVGMVMNVTRERARQMEAKALSRAKRLPVVCRLDRELGLDAGEFAHTMSQLAQAIERRLAREVRA